MIIICLLALIIILLIIHHFIKHRNDAHLSFYEKFFQLSDVDNHETVILLIFGIMVGIIIERLCNK